MKKYFAGFFVILLAFAASAFTAPKEDRSPDPEYHWFAPDGVTYLGFRSVAAQMAICNGNNQLCASSYEQITEDELPVEETFYQDVLKP